MITTYTETTPCTLCGAANNTPHRYEHFTVPSGVASLGHNACEKCGMRYVSPRLNSHGLAYLYDENYDTATVSGEYNVDDHVSKHEYTSFESYVRSNLPEGGKLLDVGCGVGMLLRRFAADASYEFEGLEFSEYAAKKARQTGAVVHTGDLTNSSLPAESYDALTCLYVLEHVPDPVGVLKAMHRLCKPNGHIFCAVPNYRYLRLRSDNVVARLATRGRATLHAAEHLQNFTDKTIADAVQIAGFEIVERHYTRPLATGSKPMQFAKKVGAAPAEFLAKAGYGLGGIHIIARRSS